MARPRTDFTNIKCCICEKRNLTSRTTIRGEYAREDLRWKWICIDCYAKEHRKNPNSTKSIIKSLAGCRTGNVNPNGSRTIGDLSEELTCRWRGVKNLNKENDNYNSPIDHSADSKLGILQTKSSLYHHIEQKWDFDVHREHKKDFNNVICYCIGKDRKTVDITYIFPKDIILKITHITIYKNPSKTVWYEKYRITDKEEIEKINEIWKKIIEGEIYDK